jgi:uncharacterized repeat protein (TIGR01451 family)
MQKAFLLLFSLIITLTGFSQTPGIRWQRTLGDQNNNDYFFTIKTDDNAIITVGIEQSFGFEFYIVKKITKDGIIQWQKAIGTVYPALPIRGISYVYNSDGSIVILFYSHSGEAVFYVSKIDKNGNILWEGVVGPDDSAPNQIIKSTTGGYLLTGNTGNNSAPGFHGTAGNSDAYLVKLSENGGVEWHKALGGTGLEGGTRRIGKGKLVQTSDGSIFLLTETSSNNGDVTGNHGANDLWLVKLNSGGAVLWAKCFGGTGDEISVDLKLSPSGELCLFGLSTSAELTTNGAQQVDFYFARVSQAGDLLFQKCYGSTGGGDIPIEIASVDNEGYVLVGQVNKGDGDVQNYHGAGTSDIWIFKLGLAGNILWQKCIGGTANEYLKVDPDFFEYDRTAGGVSQTSDGGYLISATTESNNGDVNGYHGGVDILTAKVSSLGTLEWTRSLGGTGRELSKGAPIEFVPGEYFIGGTTLSNNGDIQVQYGGSDGWLVRLGAINTIKGTIFIDQNSNGIKDAGDVPFSDVKINLSKGTESWTVVPFNGNFFATSDTGAFISKPILEHPYYTVVPTQHTSNFATYFNTDSFSFALQPIPGQKDLTVNISPITPARPGFLMDYEISYKNAGNVSVPSGQVIFKKDSRLEFVSAVPAITSSNGDTLKWDYTNLDPAATGLISLKVRLAPPPAVNNGDSVFSTAIITPVAGDLTPADDTATVRQIVQGSYDPNDKAENAGLISLSQIAAGDYINYVIRFQNTGTDLAFNITVRDTLDTKLDWSSFEMVGSSHPYLLEINDDNRLAWTFNNILLPDSNVNEPGSHGYIAYRIKPKSTLNNGDVMRNKASIYFDFNLPVVTNETVTTVGFNALVLPLHLLDFSANYQKPDARLEWSTSDENNVDKFIIERGTDPIHFTTIGTVAAKGGNGVTHYQFKDGLASTSGNKFYYRLKMVDIDRKFSFSNIELVTREGKSVNELVVNPNPVKGRTGFAWINLQKETLAEIGVVDIKGNYRSLGQQRINKGFNVVPLDFFGLSAGTYFLQVKTGQERLISRFVLVQ